VPLPGAARVHRRPGIRPRRHDGYRHRELRNGCWGPRREAFRAAQEAGERFALVITDLGMPHVDGRTVARAVKSAAPDVPVILLTGWGQRMLAENDRPPGVDRVLSKPPKLSALRAALAELTAQPPP
jgi:CheY-like chemotaxis protein